MATMDTPMDTRSATTPSAVDAISPAFENVKRVLFSPFNLRKWLMLAFIAMFAGVMGGGGGNGGGNWGGRAQGQPGGGGGAQVEAPFDWLVSAWQSDPVAVIGLGASAVLLLLSIWLLMLYISSVFRFIFLESVVTGKPEVRAGWHRNRAEGAAYMWWQIGFGLIALLAFVLLGGWPLVVAISTLVGASKAGGSAIGGAILLLVIFALWALFLGLVIGVVSALTRDFVLPIMYKERVGTIAAWKRFWPVLGRSKWGFVVYFLLKFVMAIVALIASFIGVVLALIVAAIPLALVGLGVWGAIAALGITSWSWWYLALIIPAGIGVILLLSYWITCVLLPIPVYFQSYALKYLGYVEPKAATI